MNLLFDFFVLVVYQPFFNLLVGIYWVLLQLPHFPHADMGVAVIIFTLALRLIMLPLSLRATRTEKERFDIEEKIKEVKTRYATDPIALNTAMKTVFRERPSMLLAEGFNLFIQVAIALMLWRIFATGLGGADIHLLYPFMPHPDQPYNLKFLGIYDLTHSHIILNIIQSGVVFILETLHLLTSPFPVTRKDAIRLQLFLPLVSYIIFSMLPAGKKLFVITTLCFSIGFTIIRHIGHLLNRVLQSPDSTLAVINPAPLANPSEPGSLQVAPEEKTE